jgi:nucleotide-binding universal stress UspA family protein
MIPKKLFFPVGGGDDELRGRVYGALLVAKYFNTHIEILVSQANVARAIPQGMGVSDDILKRLEKIYLENLKNDDKKDQEILKQCAVDLGIEMTCAPIEGKTTACLNVVSGLRSQLVTDHSKFCDMVIAATPPKGEPTATFESAVMESGKPVMIIPRKLEKFSTDNVLIGWNNSPQASRAITEAIPMMKNAKKVHIVSTKSYTTKELTRVKKLQEYLKIHGIETTYEIIKTTLIPGEALLNSAKRFGADLIVAGAYGRKGVKELFLGGSSPYILKHTDIPTFVAH